MEEQKTKSKKRKLIRRGASVQKAATVTNREPREAFAVGRYLKISPTKVRGVLDLIRGQPVVEARRILRFSPRRGARFALKVLNSAAANAGISGGVDGRAWSVFEARADKGPSFRRKRDHKARGQWGIIATPSTHLIIKIREKLENKGAK